MSASGTAGGGRREAPALPFAVVLDLDGKSSALGACATEREAVRRAEAFVATARLAGLPDDSAVFGARRLRDWCWALNREGRRPAFVRVTWAGGGDA